MIKKLSLAIAGSLAALVWIVAGTTAQAADKITICHVTQSDTNTYVWITISVNALDVHLENGDFIPTDTTVGCTTGGDPSQE